MDVRVAPQAESDLDEIWYFLATQSSSADVADGVVDSITARFALLARQPYIGRRRDEDLRPGVRSLVVGDYVIAFRVDGQRADPARAAGAATSRRRSAISAASAPQSCAAFDERLERMSVTVHARILTTRSPGILPSILRTISAAF
jgi:plasmid stabilization system protein ParE